MSTNNFIETDSYTTDANHSRSILDTLSFGTSLYFGPKFLSMLWGSRSLALQNKFDTHTWAKRSMDIMHLIEDCGAKMNIEGLANIDKAEGPVVFISNHMSMLESMIFPGLIASRREVTFVVKKSLTSHSLFGPTMRARKPIAVDRKDPIADFKMVMNEGVEALNTGTSVVIFPQSQRMVQFDPEKFNTLGIKLAKKSKMLIIPVAIKTDFWGNGTFAKDIGALKRNIPVHIKFGEPFAVEGPGKKEHQQVIDFIQSNLKDWTKD
ncbi:MAG: 1-acyl-sn-glycerol-3-phosphate acyltransferase [Salibacteraceae bacterium]|jgi:1-acyl-sn-glycerol-3-phosphate acyltransferase